MSRHKKDLETIESNALSSDQNAVREGSFGAPVYQHAAVWVRLGKRAGFGARVDITNGGLLSVAALVSCVLLSTAVIVGVATREKRLNGR